MLAPESEGHRHCLALSISSSPTENELVWLHVPIGLQIPPSPTMYSVLTWRTLLNSMKFESRNILNFKKKVFKPGFFNLLSYISKNLTHDAKLP